MDKANTAALLAVPTRMAMLFALLDGSALPASELAYRAGISPQTASHHLALLVEAHLLVVERCLRYRYYRIASPSVIEAIESLLVISGQPTLKERADHGQIEPLRLARTCYDHLAGHLAVCLADALLEQDWITLQERDFQVTERGEGAFAELGIDLSTLRKQHRLFARRCIDWSERRPHIGGALGASLLTRFVEMDWMRKRPRDRQVHLSSTGQQEFWKRFRVEVRL